MSGTLFIRSVLVLQNLLIGLATILSVALISSHHEHFKMDIYFATVMMASLCLSLFSTTKIFRSAENTIDQWKASDITLVVGLTALAAYLHFYGLTHHDLWFDEDLQVGQLLRWQDPIRSAVRSIQSPIEYYFSLFSLNFFGTSFFAMRFFPALWATLMIPIAYVFCRQFWRTGSSVLVSLIIVFQPWLLAYGREGRPYAGALLVAMLLLQWLWWAYKQEQKTALWMGVFALELVLFFYLSVIPVSMVLVLSTCLLFYASGIPRAFVRRFITVTSIAILIWLPLLVLILQEESNELRSNSLAELVYEAGLYSKMILGMLGPAALGLFVIAWALVRKRGAALANALFLFILIYPASLFVVVKPVFPYSIEERYMLLYVLCFFFVLGLALHTLSKDTRGKYRQIFGGMAVVLIVIYALWPSRKFGQPYWRELYSWWGVNTKSGTSIAAIFSPKAKDLHEYAGFLGVDFYEKELRENRVILKSNWDVTLRQSAELVKLLQENPNPARIFLFSYGYEHKTMWEKLNLDSLPFVRIDPFSADTYLVEIDASGDAIEKLIQFIETVKAQDSRPELQWRYDQFLFGLSALKVDCDMARGKSSALQSSFKRGSEKKNQKFLQQLMATSCPKESSN